MNVTKSVEALKNAVRGASALMIVKKAAEIKWNKDDNCCLLYLIWETLTKEQRALLTVQNSMKFYCKHEVPVYCDNYADEWKDEFCG